MVALSLVEQLRGLGLAMGTQYAPATATDAETGEEVTTRLVIGWTTDEAKATAAEEAGAWITAYQRADTPPRFRGWEVAVREVVE